MGALYTLWIRKYVLARFCAAGQVTFILLGWALALTPYIVPPDLSIENVQAPAVTLHLVVWATVGGAVLLIPSLVYLFRVFKLK